MKHAQTADQREATRFDTALPLEMEGVPGFTRDVSATGIYFETDALQEIGPVVSFTMRYRLGGKLHELQCDARVVRVEAHGDRIGIAAKLMAPFFEDVEEINLLH
jgi:hypothetical protein